MLHYHKYFNLKNPQTVAYISSSDFIFRVGKLYLFRVIFFYFQEFLDTIWKYVEWGNFWCMAKPIQYCKVKKKNNKKIKKKLNKISFLKSSLIISVFQGLTSWDAKSGTCLRHGTLPLSLFCLPCPPTGYAATHWQVSWGTFGALHQDPGRTLCILVFSTDCWRSDIQLCVEEIFHFLPSSK